MIVALPLLAGCDLLFSLDHLDEPDGGGGSGGPPAIISFNQGNCTLCSSYSLRITSHPGRAHTMLLASVAASMDGGTASPAITSVTYDGTPLVFVQRGTVQNRPFLEQWQLLDPAAGDGMLDVTLAGPTTNLFVGAVEIDGARAGDPVRTSTTNGNQLSTNADTPLQSMDGDLVVDTVCAGTSVDAPGMGQTELFHVNLTAAGTCGNFGQSWTPGALNLNLHWDVNGMGTDYWVLVASSIASQ